MKNKERDKEKQGKTRKDKERQGLAQAKPGQVRRKQLQCFVMYPVGHSRLQERAGIETASAEYDSEPDR
jgi:hypothetical protein